MEEASANVQKCKCRVYLPMVSSIQGPTSPSLVVQESSNCRPSRKPTRSPRCMTRRRSKSMGKWTSTSLLKTMCRQCMYIKMDTADQLLLSEGVCHQLGMVTFHPKAERWKGRTRKELESGPITPCIPRPDIPESPSYS